MVKIDVARFFKKIRFPRLGGKGGQLGPKLSLTRKCHLNLTFFGQNSKSERDICEIQIYFSCDKKFKMKGYK